jgi:hypothetical protein
LLEEATIDEHKEIQAEASETLCKWNFTIDNFPASASGKTA